MTACLHLFPLLLGLATPLSAQKGGAGAAAQDDPFLDDDDFFDDDLDALLLGEDPGTGESGVLRGWKGFVQLTPRLFLRDRGGPKNDEQLLFETEFEFDLRFREDLSGYVRPNLLIDLSDGEVLRALPLEAYVTFEREEWDLRAGLLVENWGIVDTYPTRRTTAPRMVPANWLEPKPLYCERPRESAKADAKATSNPTTLKTSPSSLLKKHPSE